MKVVTSPQMQALDRSAIEEFHIPGLLLMENAGRQVAEKCMEHFSKAKNYLVVCGAGNNGGDGFVAARHLHKKNFLVKIAVTEPPTKFSEDASVNFNICQSLGISTVLLNNVGIAEKLSDLIKEADVIVDALFGTGLTRPLTGSYEYLVKRVNASKKSVVSVDIPSGLSSDTGKRIGECISADFTVTFELPKIAHLVYPAAENTGRVEIVSIGIPKEAIEKSDTKVFLITNNLVKSFLKTRKKSSHKGTYGHAFIWAGSSGKAGAAVMCARACVVSGAGLTTLAIDKNLLPKIAFSHPELMSFPLPEENSFNEKLQEKFLSEIEKCNAVAIGPGLGQSKSTENFFNSILPQIKIPLVIDADGMNLLAKNPEILKQLNENTILTPHPGEMKRLFPAGDAVNLRLETAQTFAKEYKVHLVLKGANTIIACPDGETFINTTGGAELAKGGSGDVLTGIIVSLLAQGYTPKQSCILGVYMHGLAGDLAAEENAEESVMASDVIGKIGEGYKKIKSAQYP